MNLDMQSIYFYSVMSTSLVYSYTFCLSFYIFVMCLVRLGVDFVLPLSQEEEQQEEPPPKISAVTDRILMKL